MDNLHQCYSMDFLTLSFLIIFQSTRASVLHQCFCNYCTITVLDILHGRLNCLFKSSTSCVWLSCKLPKYPSQKTSYININNLVMMMMMMVMLVMMVMMIVIMMMMMMMMMMVMIMMMVMMVMMMVMIMMMMMIVMMMVMMMVMITMMMMVMMVMMMIMMMMMVIMMMMLRIFTRRSQHFRQKSHLPVFPIIHSNGNQVFFLSSCMCYITCETEIISYQNSVCTKLK